MYMKLWCILGQENAQIETAGVLRKFHDQKAPEKAEIFLFPSGLFMEFVPYYEGVRLFNRPVEKEKFYETKK